MMCSVIVLAAEDEHRQAPLRLRRITERTDHLGGRRRF